MKSDITRIALLLAGAAFWTAGAQAQNVVVLDEVTINAADNGAVIDHYRAGTVSSATRTETPLKETPQSVVVVTPDILKDQGVTTLSGALRNVSGAQGALPLQTPAYESTMLGEEWWAGRFDPFPVMDRPGWCPQGAPRSRTVRKPILEIPSMKRKAEMNHLNIQHARCLLAALDLW